MGVVLVEMQTPIVQIFNFIQYSLIIRFQIGDISLRCGEMGEKVGKSRNLGLTLTRTNLFGGIPKILKPVLDTPFSGPIARKSLDHARP